MYRKFLSTSNPCSYQLDQIMMQLVTCATFWEYFKQWCNININWLQFTKANKHWIIISLPATIKPNYWSRGSQFEQTILHYMYNTMLAFWNYIYIYISLVVEKFCLHNFWCHLSVQSNTLIYHCSTYYTSFNFTKSK